MAEAALVLSVVAIVTAVSGWWYAWRWRRAARRTVGQLARLRQDISPEPDPPMHDLPGPRRVDG